MKDIIQKLRKYEIRIRKAINMQMQGDYHSVFKGSGIEFDDVRAYQYGDDMRTIDWNVSAKGHGTFVKTFREEKEQTVFFLLDVSASQEIGLQNLKKIDVSKEICGVLALSAVKEQSQVGVICFSDEKEKYIRPGKGLSHAYSIITSIFTLTPQSAKTNLSKAIRYALDLLQRRSIIILISDFIDENYEPALRALARKHDLVVIHVSDARESKFPKLGIIPLYDRERGKTVWVNTSSSFFTNDIGKHFAENKLQLETTCKKYQANYLFVDTSEDYIPSLIKLFKVRNQGMKRSK
jgi:uncharacterized protein (DUF58 family)